MKIYNNPVNLTSNYNKNLQRKLNIQNPAFTSKISILPNNASARICIFEKPQFTRVFEKIEKLFENDGKNYSYRVSISKTGFNDNDYHIYYGRSMDPCSPDKYKDDIEHITEEKLITTLKSKLQDFKKYCDGRDNGTIKPPQYERRPDDFYHDGLRGLCS